MFEWILKKIRKDNKGFTLVELVVVIAILAVLALLAVPRLAGTTDKAAKSAHNANVRTLESAASMCIAEEGLPKTKVTWNGTGETGDTKTGNYGWEKYIQEWPKVPKGLTVKDGEPAVGANYIVEIEATGKITVKPAKQD